MPDIVDAVTRSRMMSGIRGKNTQPEVALRKALHRRGFRYLLHSARVLGKPDLALPTHSAVIFVNGCFWHGHDCRLFRLPSTHSDFWQEKIDKNRRRDAIVKQQLADEGWRHLVVWECATRGKGKDAVEDVAERAAAWLRTSKKSGEIRG